ncbi:hypothetical protein VTK73DRAFT_4477 [Phialemonium thermophilum]|uniref:Potassium transport protein n=1 Tax=Phialemonium thermophilum TaxID=223376 RepID=A0ABR3WTC2_9PEZI
MGSMERFKELLWGQIQELRPSFMSKKPHFNFISSHYFWIIGLTIVGSILIYAPGRGNIAYIDALFFASASNTQAGLNTIDVNRLNTFQQVVMYLLILMANPITVHSFVVFLRLYWFEKRFQHIVREARLRRSTLAKSRTKSIARNDPGQVERGVNGRNITVMHNGRKSRITNDGLLLDPTQEKADTENGKGQQLPNGAGSRSSWPADAQEGRRPEIKFAGTVKRSDGLEDDMKLPPVRPDEDHIAILERQRKRDDEVLRIPGPRDAERGMLPERVEQTEDDETEPISPKTSRVTADQDEDEGEAVDTRGMAEGRTQAITIEEPEHPKRQERLDHVASDAEAAANALGFLRLRKPRLFNKGDKKIHHEENDLHITHTRRRSTLENLRTVFTRDKDLGTPYLSWEPTLGRNSQFHDLTEEQRDELGGIEYRSLKTLATILVCYFWGFWLFAVVCLLPWILESSTYGAVVDAAKQSRAWWGFFTANSAFMDVGLTLTPDSMNSFKTAIYPLLIMSFLVVIGNTGFPVMLRFIIWVISLIIPQGTGLWEELRFLLDHPRRCFTLLFPSGATWWLFWLLVILNGIDLIFFIVLDLGKGPVTELPPGLQFVNGLFQAVCTRTAGFSSVNIAMLHPAVQTSYLIMMYISVFPIAISVRRTNVYEERSLGMYGNDVDESTAASDLSYVGAHLRRQLSFDLWYIFVGFFILTITEGSRLMSGDFTMFAVLFEVVSAYGTVGMSFGYPTVNASLSSQFTVLGKLVIIAMQIRGRHRGLPYGLDRAILLPSESLNAKEHVNPEDRPARRMSVASGTTSGPGRHGTSTQRSRSRSVDRVNSNIIAQILHPGPPVPSRPSDFPSLRRSTTSPSDMARDADPYSSSRPLAPRAETATVGRIMETRRRMS